MIGQIWWHVLYLTNLLNISNCCVLGQMLLLYVSTSTIAVRRWGFQSLYLTTMGNMAPMMRTTRFAWALHNLHLTTRDIIFGLFRCLSPYVAFIVNLKRTRVLLDVYWDSPKVGFGLLLVWCTPRFGWQCSHLFKLTALTEQLYLSSF